ncbi:MAG: GNAT family N-acetyltransferase [Chloroflexota bacterium]|nr:MAG: GNAT family N-acetyltransferase [Chloroflexota bacterium]
MNDRSVEVRPVGWRDLPAVTRMTFDNMIGVDRYFTRMVRNPLGRWFTYGMLPLYLQFSGQGYKALVDGQTAGCAFLHLRRSSGYIFNVSVNGPYRRQGVGRRLMLNLEEMIKGRGREWAVLQVDLGNEPAERMYRQLGYRPFHPHFLRREMSPPISRAMTGGAAIQRLGNRPGFRRFQRYLNLERGRGELWASSVIDEYDSWPGRRGAFWRCLLYDREIGCAQVIDLNSRSLIRLTLKPDYWGYLATGGLVKKLIDSLTRRPDYVDLFLESSAHHRAAMPVLKGMGFAERSRSRLLMLKPLPDGDSGQSAVIN